MFKYSLMKGKVTVQPLDHTFPHILRKLVSYFPNDLLFLFLKNFYSFDDYHPLIYFLTIKENWLEI